MLFDAFIVRMVIIPSVMALMGDKAWWLPKWLDKILPNVDIEGEKLARSLPRDKQELEDAPSPERDCEHSMKREGSGPEKWA